VGMAFEAGWTKKRLALFRLIVNGAEIPGRFILANGEFHQMD
jgi:hypothetical protein